MKPHFVSRTLLVVIFVQLTGLAALFAEDSNPPQSPYTVHRGELGESLYAIAMPEYWSGGLVLANHGTYALNMPLSADYIPYSWEPFATLLERGWAIASSSYRRNGTIIEEAIEDVTALDIHFSKTFGEPDSRLLVGWSLGNAISLRMLERDTDGRYSGGLLFASGLYITEEGEEVAPITHRVNAPVLIMQNQSEIDGGLKYARKATQAAQTVGEAPVHWTVARNGHVRFSSPEYALATDAVLDWMAGGERPDHLTFMIKPQRPSTATVDRETGTAAGEVSYIYPDFGNLRTTLLAQDLWSIGLAEGDKVKGTVGGKEFSLKWVESYFDVEAGDWLIFETGDGYLQVAISFGNAAAVSKATVGSPIILAKP